MVAGNLLYFIYLRRAMHLFTPTTLHICKHIYPNVICHILIYTCVEYTFLMCKHIKMYTFLCENTSATEHVHIYIYIYTHIHIFLHIYIYVYITAWHQASAKAKAATSSTSSPSSLQATEDFALGPSQSHCPFRRGSLNSKSLTSCLNLSRKFAQNCFFYARALLRILVGPP